MLAPQVIPIQSEHQGTPFRGFQIKFVFFGVIFFVAITKLHLFTVGEHVENECD